MTTPNERTEAVVETREFLQILARADEVTIQGLVQSVAICLLRHYPLEEDLAISAAVIPSTWAYPKGHLHEECRVLWVPTTHVPK
jgi:hypothetical protein